MEKVLLKNVKQGDYFTLKPLEYPKENQVYIRGEYDRSEKKYNCVKWVDCLGNGRNLKGDKEVYIGFTF